MIASKTTEYSSWHEMKKRCLKKSHKSYPQYGGRGITIHPTWVRSFNAFLADMGYKPSTNHSIDRIDNNGNYEPSNCRWATRKDQCNNTRRSKLLEYNGKQRPLSVWCYELGLDYQATKKQLLQGYPVSVVFDYAKYLPLMQKVAL
jgi:hypothetical protein